MDHRVVSFSVTLNDLYTQISRARRYSTLNISETVVRHSHSGILLKVSIRMILSNLANVQRNRASRGLTATFGFLEFHMVFRRRSVLARPLTL